MAYLFMNNHFWTVTMGLLKLYIQSMLMWCLVKTLMNSSWIDRLQVTLLKIYFIYLFYFIFFKRRCYTLGMVPQTERITRAAEI